MSRRAVRRLMPPPPAFKLYAQAAAIEKRGVELEQERHSRRLRRLGRDIARQVEELADTRAGSAP